MTLAGGLSTTISLAACLVTTEPEGSDTSTDWGTRPMDSDIAADAGERAEDGGSTTPTESGDPWALGPPYGARLHPDGDLEVRVWAPRASRVELALFSVPMGQSERLRLALRREGEVHRLRVRRSQLMSAGLAEPYYYGLRAFGPNWRFDPSWAPGSGRGFLADVDGEGNRMNPNKLLLDPYALELSHDPVNATHRDQSVYESGAEHRNRDSGPFAPKGVVFTQPTPMRAGPDRPFKDEIIYEVHLRGLTAQDPEVPPEERGTYAGAARRARYLRELGVTAVEFLPLHETPNDQNPLTEDAEGDNYWGYYSSSFFAPDRRYAADRSPGGPTRELRALVEAFHAEGLKVYVDVVFNHTAEGGARGDRARVMSWRGLDNAAYYELAGDPAGYVDNNGVGPNLNLTSPLAADMVLASLHYWHEVLGVDGFRLDLASVLGNRCPRGCFEYERDGYLARLVEELPARPSNGGAGVDLIAEPWALGWGTYQVGNFPRGWAEWNDQFRDTIRRDLNRLDVEDVTPRVLRRRISGSPDLYDDDGRPPSSSVNFVTCHDGSTLHDLFSYASRNNTRPWPCGPSDGGAAEERQWDHRGDPVLQRRAARTALGLTLLSAGVPMILGGDEMLRTQQGNNNAYNIDSECTWLDWSLQETHESFAHFTRELLAFRSAHSALRPADYWRDQDGDGDGLPQVSWYRDDGELVDARYLDDPTRHFLAFSLDADEFGDPAAALYVAYNGWSQDLELRIPEPPGGTVWHLVADTGTAAEGWSNFRAPSDREAFAGSTYKLEARALALWVAQ